MRSKLGTKSRLAAHILALILLILMLVYLTPTIPAPELKPMRPTIHTRQPEVVPARTPELSNTSGKPDPANASGASSPSGSEKISDNPDTSAVSGTVKQSGQSDSSGQSPLAQHAPLGKTDTLDQVKTPMVATRIPSSQLRPPGTAGASVNLVEPAPSISAAPAPHVETLQETRAARPITESLRPRAPAASQTAEKDDKEVTRQSLEPEQPDDEIRHEENEGHHDPHDDLPTPSSESSHEEDDDAKEMDEDAQALDSLPEAESGADEVIDELVSLSGSGGIGIEADDAHPGEGEHSESDAHGADRSYSGDDGSALAPSGDLQAVVQPDESGALIVAPSETAAPISAATPLANANLEVLGDGIFWLDPRHDLEKELAAIPDIGTLVLLTPLPGFQISGFEHVKIEAIPADAADIIHDSAERFLHVVSDASRPIVVAPLSGARGAAFFKGAYLLARRNLNQEEVMREIEPELEQAGEAREEIVHRLLRLTEVDG